MGWQIQFDVSNRLLLVRLEGQLTNEAATECYEAVEAYALEKSISAGIVDLSAASCKALHVDRTRWDLFPCRGSVVPCRTLPSVSATCNGTITRWKKTAGESAKLISERSSSSRRPSNRLADRLLRERTSKAGGAPYRPR